MKPFYKILKHEGSNHSYSELTHIKWCSLSKFKVSSIGSLLPVPDVKSN